MQLIVLMLIVFCPLCIPAGLIIHKKIPVFPLFVFAIAAAVTVFLCSILEAGFFLPYYPEAQTAPGRSLLPCWIAAVTEESVKLLVFSAIAGYYGSIPIMQRTAKHQQVRLQLPESSGITLYSMCLVYALFFGLSFGGFETLSYTIRDSSILPYRMVSATALHGGIASFYCTFWYKTHRASDHQAAKRLSFVLLPILLHGLYNTFSVLGGIFTIFAYSIATFTCLYTYTTLKGTSKNFRF
ncbi:MAG: PrsW family glutamic-type intramembrane protease [Treponema sp.]